MALIPFSTGDTVLNLGFVERVKAHVFPDMEPENLAFPHARFIQNALIVAQTYVPCLRNNNVNFYDKSDLIIGCNVASFDGPEHSRIQAVYAFKPCGQCKRQHYEQRSVGAIMCYVDAYSQCRCQTEGDICNAIKSGEQVCDEALGGTEAAFLCEDKIFAKGSSDKIYLAPSFPCDYKLAVHWEGIKHFYADGDLISSDEDLIDLIGLYLQGQRALRIDRDLQLHKEIMRKPEKFGDSGGTFWQALSAMAHRCREERRIRKDHACEAIFDDSALADLGMVAYPDIDQAECAFTGEPVECAEGEQLIDGVCVPCEDPVVAIDAESSVVLAGQSTTITWSNAVPPNTVVTLEYDGQVVPVANNSNGSFVVTPTATTIYRIHANGPCGEVIDTVGVTVEEPCVCPDGLPDCLQIDLVDPLDFTQCAADAYDECDEQDVWDGTIPRISDCVWDTGFGAENGAGAVSVNFSGPACRAFRARVELISCNPYVYELVLSSRFEGEELIFWKGRSEHVPFGTYISQDYGVGVLDNYCYAETNFSLTGCDNPYSPCVNPTIRFDPPAGSQVSFPTLVFIHSTNDDDIIVYSVDGGTTYVPYTGPFSLAEGQTLSAQAFTLAGCVGAITQANYVADTESLEFSFVCDAQDKAGVFGVFSPNGDNDYHWRINITRTLDWQFVRGTIYETNASGIWVTGQAWSTVNPIYPVEMSPDPFPVYPLVLFNGTTQLNSAYGEPVVAIYPPGNQVIHGYGQPFVALTGYFRLELIIDEGSGPFTLYKLIPHNCLTCPAVAAPTVTVDCEGQVNLQGTVTAGSQYRIRRAVMPGCGSGIFEDISSGIALSGSVFYSEAVATCCDFSYILSAYCAGTEAWVDSDPVLIHAPCESECVPVCNPESMADQYVVNGFQNIPFACAGGECSGTLWDGVVYRTNPASCVWNAQGQDGTTGFPPASCYRLYPDQDGALISVNLKLESGVWVLTVTMGDGGVSEWVGHKSLGLTPAGTYSRVSGCPTLSDLQVTEFGA